MTETSLIEAAESRRTLFAEDRPPVHYPQSGADMLRTIEQDHFWFVLRREVILYFLERFLPRDGAPVGLDIGCGTGYTADWLSRSGFPTYGMDALAGFSNEFAASKFIVGDIFSIEPKPEFDFILLLDVLEHIEDDRRFFRQCLKALKPGGLAIITVPAFGFLWSEMDDFAGHLRRYTKGRMRDVVHSVGSDLDFESLAYFFGLTLPAFMASRLGRRRLSETMGAEQHVSERLNRLLKVALALEKKLLPFGGLPAGSSLFAVVRKSGAPSRSV